MDPRRHRWAAWLAPFVLALVVALELARPFAAGPVAFDSAVSVIHFERIVDGTQMEGFLSTTPKPFLTIVYGLLHAAVPDWRVVSLSAILAFAVGVAIAAVLALRLAGPRAWAFAAMALAGAPALLFDAGLALGTAWALPLWAAAAFWVTGDRPRYALVGVALMAAALVRVETLVVVAVATAGLLAARGGPRTLQRAVPRRAWLVLLGFGAVPAMMLHDLLLTGDPMFWSTVALRYTQAAEGRAVPPADLIVLILRHFVAIGGLVVLGAIGWIGLWLRGRRALALGLLGLGPGVVAFLVLLAARGIFVPERYLAPADIAVVFAASFAIPLLRVQLPVPHDPRLRRALAASVLPAVAIVAVAVSGVWGPLAGDVRATVRRQLWVSENELQALPALLDAVRTARDTQPAADEALVLGPRPVRPHLIVDLGLPIPAVGSLNPDAIDLPGGSPALGQIVLYDERGTGTAPSVAVLAVDRPTTIGPVVVVPLDIDETRGWWLVRIDAAR